MTSPLGILDVLEDFFGEQLSRQLIARLTSFPMDQLVVLAERLEEYRAVIEATDLNGDESGSARVFGSDDVLMRGGVTTPATSLANLKFFTLVCERLLYPEPVLDWATEISLDEAIGGPYSPRIDLLQAHLRTTLTVAPLLRLKALVAVPTSRKYAPLGMEYPPPQADSWSWRSPGRHGLATWSQDPYLGHVLRHTLRVPDLYLQELHNGEELRQMVESPLDEIAIVERLADVAQDSLESLAVSAQFREYVERAGFTPIASHRSISRHLARVSAVLLGSTDPDRDLSLSEPSGVAAAAQLGLPDVSGLGFEDIATLRADEVLYADLRVCFDAVAEHVSALSPGHYGSYQEYVVETRNLVEDIVQPVYATYQRRRKSARRSGSLAELASRGTVGLAL